MSDYLAKTKSRFYGIMQWEDCDKLFATLSHNPENWYLYNLDKSTPQSVLDSASFIKKISRIQHIIKDKHQERYCGIIYADDLKNPTMIKIFDPDNLGKSCGSSENPPLAKWIISKLKPTTIEQIKEKQIKEKSQGFMSKFFK